MAIVDDPRLRHEFWKDKANYWFKWALFVGALGIIGGTAYCQTLTTIDPESKKLLITYTSPFVGAIFGFLFGNMTRQVRVM